MLKMKTDIIEHKVLSKPSPIKSGNYLTTKRMFFRQSKLLEAQITELFDDVWPTVTALKNLRWQVMGYHLEHPNHNNSQLSSKFVEFADKSIRPNLYRKCIQETWEEQEFRVASNLLSNVFACYEGWLQELLNSIQSFSERRNKRMQFPNSCRTELLLLQNGGSQTLIDAFYMTYKNKSRLYNLNHLENYLIAYRYFKECRNAIIHCGGLTTQNVVDACAAYKRLSSADIDVAELPIYIETTKDNPLELSLRGVVGFSQVILRLVSTLDVEFIKCKNADLAFLNSIMSLPHDNFPYMASTSLNKRNKDIEHVCGRAYFNCPSEFDNLFSFLRANKIMI